MFLKISKNIIEEEANALLLLSKSLDTNYNKVLSLLSKANGNIILSGVGKSGHIARKIASTLTSTGSPAYFIHPTEASHGDLGSIRKKDILCLLSKSGKSKELLDILHFANKNKIKSILISNNKKSKLAQMSSYNLIIPNIKEVGKNNIAPTTSTTMMLALGDAIALSMSAYKKFSKEMFVKFHPGGNIGAKFIKVKDIMHSKSNIPLTYENTNMKDVIVKITNKNFGCIGVLDLSKSLVGIITDGDLRRHMKDNVLQKKAKDVMSKNPRVITENTFVSDALKIINDYKITSLFIMKNLKNKKPSGIIHLHDCLRVKG
ncbi:KpsF/GutQ family sugar-phosphate isomerase [Alphaproteobacteria bacterium]|nr:KpsF/GutQ family sugar-phosphate isomerase [Alphaproteobacteria bacterium]